MQSSARSSRDAGRASRASLAHVVVNFRPRIHRRVVWFDVRQLRRVAHRPRDGQDGRTGRTDRQLDRRTRALDCSNAPARGSRWFFLLFGTFFARSRPARTHFACFERHVSDAPDRDRPRPARPRAAVRARVLSATSTRGGARASDFDADARARRRRGEGDDDDDDESIARARESMPTIDDRRARATREDDDDDDDDAGERARARCHRGRPGRGELRHHRVWTGWIHRRDLRGTRELTSIDV